MPGEETKTVDVQANLQVIKFQTPHLPPKHAKTNLFM